MKAEHRAAIAQAMEALELAQNGLGWYRAEFPDADSPADDEAEEQIDAALSALSAILAEPETDDAPAQPEVPNIPDALKAAVAAIYFDDSSDYSSALWEVVRALSPAMAELLEANPSAAYHRADAIASQGTTP